MVGVVMDIVLALSMSAIVILGLYMVDYFHRQCREMLGAIRDMIYAAEKHGPQVCDDVCTAFLNRKRY